MTASTNKDFIENYLKETKEIIDKFNVADIDAIIEILFEAWKTDAMIYTVGNGGSASTATHFAADLCKTINWDLKPHKKGFKAMSLVDNIPLTSAWTNDTSFENLFAGQLENFLKPGDVVVGFSVHGGSGWSGNLVKAIEIAKKRQAKSIGFSGFDGGKMKEDCDACIVVPADSTPHVEGLHLVIHHLIIFRLKEKINAWKA